MSSWPPPQRIPAALIPPHSEHDAARSDASNPASGAGGITGQTARISQLPYLPGLDGLRALAVVAVMLYHANHEWLSGGFIGVEVFFVISGYLITLLLIAEHERSNRISLAQFWQRRARRLLPALFAMLAGLALYMALFYDRPLGRTRGDFVSGLAYVSNWFQIVVGQSYTDVEAFAPLRHLWSLAVEEQFYLVWPLVMVLLLRKGRDRLPTLAMRLFATSFAIALVVALVYVPGDIDVECAPGGSRGYATVLGRCINVNDALYLSTFSRASGLLLGAAFAMVWRPGALLRGPMRRKGHLLDVFALIGLATLAMMAWRLHVSTEGSQFGSRFDPWLFRGGFFVAGLATLAVLAAVVHRGAFAGRLLGNRVLRWAGTRSYGLYLYHWPVYQVIRKNGFGLSVWQFVLAMAITLPLTEASYRFIESPIRTHGWLGWRTMLLRSARDTVKRRRRVLGALAVGSVAIGFAGMSVAVADNRCVGDVECSIVAGEAESAGGNGEVPNSTPDSGAGPATEVPTTETTTAATDITAATSDPTANSVTPDTVAPTTAPTTTTAPAPVLAPVALGESVMLGAITELQAGGFYVDAAKNRQGPGMAELVESLRGAGQIGATIVIQIGTNGAISQETLDRIMAQLPSDLTPQVVFMTVSAPRGWIEGNNALIRDLPNRYPNVTIADWQAATATTALCSDGIHLVCGTGAQQAYANVIFDAVGRPDLKR